MSSPSLYLELAALGVASGAFVSPTLDGNAITFWRFTTVKHTPFAIEPRNFTANGSARFGASNVKFTVPRSGDLLWSTFVHFRLPGIGEIATPSTAAAASPAWVDGVGHALITDFKLLVGGAIIDELDNNALAMWEELSGQPGKRLAEKIGRYGGDSDANAARRLRSRFAQDLYVPIHMSFSQHTGLALPMVALQFHSVEFQISFANIDDVLDRNNDRTAVVKTESDKVNGATAITGDGALTNADLEVDIEAFLVYLDHDERSKFAMGSFEQVVTQTQRNTLTVSGTGATGTNHASHNVSTRRLELNLNHLVRELIVAVRPHAFYAADGGGADARHNTTQVEVPQHNLDFRGVVTGGGANDSRSGMAFGTIAAADGLEVDPIQELGLFFNNQARYEVRPGKFYRLVTPYVFHTNIPDRFLYVIPFAVDPEDANPCGAFNASRTDKVELSVKLAPGALNSGAATDSAASTTSGTATIEVMAVSNNILRISQGLLAKRFAM